MAPPTTALEHRGNAELYVTPGGALQAGHMDHGGSSFTGRPDTNTRGNIDLSPTYSDVRTSNIPSRELQNAGSIVLYKFAWD
jgi:hypothetical protein